MTCVSILESCVIDSGGDFTIGQGQFGFLWQPAFQPVWKLFLSQRWPTSQVWAAPYVKGEKCLRENKVLEGGDLVENLTEEKTWPELLVRSTLDIWISSNEVDETGAYYTEWSKPERKTPIQYTNAYIWNLERW